MTVAVFSSLHKRIEPISAKVTLKIVNDLKKFLFEHYNEAEQRFDYFVVGGTGAICAYVGQTINPQLLAFTPYSLEVLSLLLLLLSLIFGFLRLEQITFIKSLSYMLADARERIPERCAEIVKKRELVSKHAVLSYRLRNDLLIAGLYGLILSKILSPYFH